MQPTPLIPTPPPVAPGSKSRKDASHRAFYAGFFKGAISAFNGIELFFRTPALRKMALDVMVPLLNAQMAYLGLSLLIFYVFRDGHSGENGTSFLWTVSKWGRIVTVLMNVILDLHRKANIDMFFTALAQKNPTFADELKQKPFVHTSLKTRWINFSRIAKLTMFRLMGHIIRLVFPGGRYIALPALKFMSMRPVLGNALAGSLSVIYFLPQELLESSIMDDILISFGESVVDADDYGTDMLKRYYRRLDPPTKEYFEQRYRGYIIGCGFVYSFLSAIPFLGIPIALVSECGAACLLADVTERNLDKRLGQPLLCEEQFQHEKSS